MTFNDPLIHKCSADKSIQTIVEQTGYRDCTHFVKSFKRVVGVTPMQYSNSKKGSEKQSYYAPHAFYSPSKHLKFCHIFSIIYRNYAKLEAVIWMAGS